MLNTHPRRHITHFEVPSGTAHITWRLRGEQPLMTPTDRGDVLAVLSREEGVRCRINAAVVMDDHVHFMIQLNSGATASKIIHSCKSITAHRLAKVGPRTAPIWQAEYYLRWMNGPSQIEACAAYIRNNPGRRWPGVESYPWMLP